jgi:hypothetical protein
VIKRLNNDPLLINHISFFGTGGGEGGSLLDLIGIAITSYAWGLAKVSTNVAATYALYEGV